MNKLVITFEDNTTDEINLLTDHNILILFEKIHRVPKRYLGIDKKIKEIVWIIKEDDINGYIKKTWNNE